MKKTILFAGCVFAAFTSVAAQTRPSGQQAGSSPTIASDSAAVRNRVVGQARVSNHLDKPQPVSSGTAGADEKRPAWGDTTVTFEPRAKAQPLPQPPSAKPASPKLVEPTVMPVSSPSMRVRTPANRPETSGNPATPRTPNPGTYLVGVGDVLDIRLANLPTRESTLFTVLKSGTVEYPLLNGPLVVAGMTTDQIARLVSTEIKVISDARATVSVRDYASHALTISGLVDNPGRKILRREAMPLFAVLAEALPRQEAATVTVTRGGSEQTLSMANEQAMAALVLPGDVIKVSAAAPGSQRFLYIGGFVATPGEKEFRDGMTLTQAILAAGGVPDGTRSTVRIARRNSNGFLTTKDYSLVRIGMGQEPDPLLEAGDRIEVIRDL